MRDSKVEVYQVFSVFTIIRAREDILLPIWGAFHVVLCWEAQVQFRLSLLPVCLIQDVSVQQEPSASHSPESGERTKVLTSSAGSVSEGNIGNTCSPSRTPKWVQQLKQQSPIETATLASSGTKESTDIGAQAERTKPASHPTAKRPETLQDALLSHMANLRAPAKPAVDLLHSSSHDVQVILPQKGAKIQQPAPMQQNWPASSANTASGAVTSASKAQGEKVHFKRNENVSIVTKPGSGVLKKRKKDSEYLHADRKLVVGVSAFSSWRILYQIAHGER